MAVELLAVMSPMLGGVGLAAWSGWSRRIKEQKRAEVEALAKAIRLPEGCSLIPTQGNSSQVKDHSGRIAVVCVGDLGVNVGKNYLNVSALSGQEGAIGSIQALQLHEGNPRGNRGDNKVVVSFTTIFQDSSLDDGVLILL